MDNKKWLDAALAAGFEAAELYETTSKDKSVGWFEGAMEKYELSETKSVGFRAVLDGNAANIGLEKLDDDDMEAVIKGLKEQAQTITSEDKTELVPPMETELVQRTRTWVRPDTALVQEKLAELEKKILAYDGRIIQAAWMEWSQGDSSRAITNTLGLETGDADYVQYIGASAVAKEGDVIQDFTLVRLVPDLETFDMDAFVKDLCQEAIDRLSAKSVPTKPYKVILHRRAMSALLASFSGLFNGELIAKGISPLKDKLGKKIFSDKITIIDDPRNQNALAIANFDDEGYPTRTKTVVDKGVFTTILHNRKSAAKMGTESTGNGFKGSYASPVSVSPLNLYIEPGEKSLEQLMEQMGEGLVITDLEGLHAGIDFVSTNFSLQARGWLVKDGKKDRSVTLITAADSFLHLMNEVEAVGNDLKWEFQQILSPSILFTSMPISGE